MMTRAGSRTGRAKCAVRLPRFSVCVCVAECVERYLVANVGISNLTKHEINRDEKVARTQLSDFMAFRRQI